MQRTSAGWKQGRKSIVQRFEQTTFHLNLSQVFVADACFNDLYARKRILHRANLYFVVLHFCSSFRDFKASM